MLTRRALINETRLKGCSFSKAAIEELERVLRAQHRDHDFQPVVRQLCDRLKQLGSPGAVTPEALQQALHSLGAQEAEAEHVFVIPSSEVPKFTYDATRNVFHRSPKALTVAGSARDKADMYRDRYELLRQRVLRYDLFVKLSFDMRLAKNKLQMSTISSLDGTAPGEVATVLGMIYRKDDDFYVMEDLHNSIRVNLDQVKYTLGLFVEGAFVVAQGHFADGVYHLTGVGFPPAEPRSKSLAAVSHNLDFFGKADQRGTLEEEQGCPTMFVVLADVFLGQAKVISRLRALFGALSASEDPAHLHFLLVGSFTEAPFNYGDCSSFTSFSQTEQIRYTEGFDRLGDLIAEFPALAAKSRFTIIPGPHDPTVGGFILPQPPIPETFVGNLRRKVSHVTLTTNPCRIRFFTQEIVLFRDDLYRKTRRHCLPALPPQASEESYTHLVKTLVDQAHLSPVPVTVTPVFWAQDHALRLFPLPHQVIVCDPSSESWETEYMECTFLNPGSFAKHQTFLMYRPGPRTNQFQQMR